MNINMKNKKRWIIGDVHGCYDTLMMLISKLPKEADASSIVFLGDLCDRGPKSREVVEFIREGGYQCVIGNHEQMMIEGLEEFNLGIYNNMYTTWVYNGGDKCQKSYDGHSVQLKKDIEWLKTLPYYLTFEYPEGTKDLLLTHAPSVDYFELIQTYQDKLNTPWDEISERDREALNVEVDSFFDKMIWYRVPPRKGSDNYFGVSGHNVWNKHPDADINTKCIIDDNFASIDTGACFPQTGYRTLTCLEYPTMKLYQQDLVDEIDKEKPRAARTHAW